MVTDGLVFLFVFVFAIGVPLVLHWAMERETANLPRMDRKEAERRAQEEGERYNRSVRNRE